MIKEINLCMSCRQPLPDNNTLIIVYDKNNDEYRYYCSYECKVLGETSNLILNNGI